MGRKKDKKEPKIFKTSIREYPEAIELEKRILGTMMYKRGVIIPEVTQVLKADDFFRPSHQVIFQTLVDEYNRGVDPNLLSLIQDLKNSGYLRQMDLREICALDEYGFTTAYIADYARVIKEKSNLRKMITVAEIIAGTAGGDGDYKDILKVVSSQIESLQETNTPSGDCTIQDCFDALNGLFPLWQHEMKKYHERKTGFSNLDKNQIFSPGLYVIGGVPAAGKTTFCWQLLFQLAINGEKCVYASYEMSAFELFSKVVSREYCRRYFSDNPASCGLSAADIRGGGFSDGLKDLMNDISNGAFARIDLTVSAVRDKDIDELLIDLRRYCRKGKAPVVCIDYLQIIPHDKDSAKMAIDDIVRKLKNFQRETNATVIVISSFNRQNYSQPVSFESFKESGNIEYSADVVWGLQLYFKDEKDRSKKDKVDAAKKANPRQVQLVCLKNRQGSNYDCDFLYYPRSDLFTIDDGSEDDVVYTRA